MLKKLGETQVFFLKDEYDAEITLDRNEVVSLWEHRSASGIQMVNPRRGIIEANGKEIELNGYHRTSFLYSFMRGTLLAFMFPLDERQVIIPYRNITKIVVKRSWGLEHVGIYHKESSEDIVNIELFNGGDELKEFYYRFSFYHRW